MSIWKRKAIALFPELKFPTHLGGHEYNLYMLMVQLWEMSHQAHRAHDDALLRRIYGYAEWCIAQAEEAICVPASIVFWEHIFVPRDLRAAVVPWLSPQVIGEFGPIWRGLRLTIGEWAEVNQMIEQCKDHRYRETVFGTGEIESL